MIFPDFGEVPPEMQVSGRKLNQNDSIRAVFYIQYSVIVSSAENTGILRSRYASQDKIGLVTAISSLRRCS